MPTHAQRLALTPIQTRYRGHHFRSRLEARYAVFLDALGVRWQYEPEGFQLPSGPYLPDFFLPEINGGTWLEIKPYERGCFNGFFCGNPRYGQTDEPKLREFAEATQERGQSFYVVFGLPSDAYWGCPQQSDEGMLGATWDSFCWCVCVCGRTVGIEFDGRGGRIQCQNSKCNEPRDYGNGLMFRDDKAYSWDHQRIREAVIAARSARFEHGHSGAS